MIPSTARSDPEAGAGVAEDDLRPVLAAAAAMAHLGLARADLGCLLTELCQRLRGMGVALTRTYAATGILHPLYAATGRTWVPGANAVPVEFHTRADQAGDRWQQSPFRLMLERQLLCLGYRLDGTDALPFPILEDFRAGGASEYLALGQRFGGATTEGVLTSWLTDRAGGFAARDRGLIEALLPHFANAVAHGTSRQLAGTLLETYVGRAAGRRVLQGEIGRGALTTLRAVILFADLRGFTALADRLTGEATVELLNGYLERMAEPVLQGGGEVLKFMGDGMLGAFGVDEPVPERACAAALQAALAAQRAIGGWNEARAAAGLPVLELDMALHLGDVMYGNVGAPGRLDFTVIGPAVNEAARMESLCRQLSQSLLVSESFYRAAGPSRERLLSLGAHRLVGLPVERRLYGLAAGSDATEAAW